jgi:branched-chain amino acid transport system substrate-binding protein
VNQKIIEKYYISLSHIGYYVAISKNVSNTTATKYSGDSMLISLLRSTRRIVMSFSVVFASLAATSAAAEIVVGQIGPFTGLPSPDATEINEGAQAYFDQINREGGISGKKISFFKLDDQFKPDVFKTQFAVAMQRKPVALISPVGSGIVGSMLKEKLLADANIVVINAIAGAAIFRNPGDPKLFHIRASDADQYKRILEHGRTLGVTQIQMLYQDLPIGKSGLEVVSKIAPEYGYTKFGGVESKHDDVALAAAAKAVNATESQSVLVVGSPKFMADSIKQLRLAGYKRTVMALSYLSAPLLVNVVGVDMARGVGIVQTYPNPQGRNLPLHQDFQKTMATFAPNVKSLRAFHLEGYIAARVLVDALKRAKGNYSAEGLTAALRGAGEMNYGGFRVDFSKGNAGGNWTDMSVVDVSGALRY